MIKCTRMAWQLCGRPHASLREAPPKAAGFELLSFAVERACSLGAPDGRGFYLRPGLFFSQGSNRRKTIFSATASATFCSEAQSCFCEAQFCLQEATSGFW